MVGETYSFLPEKKILFSQVVKNTKIKFSNEIKVDTVLSKNK